MAELRRRKPTGQVAYPIILVVGEHKKGKSWETYNLANSELIGEFFAFELGERTADEYATLAPDRYEIIDHNGTYIDIFEQVKAATAIPQADGKPNVISLDSGTALWDLHKAYADSLAKRTKRGREALAADPDAEVETQMAQWTATKDRWWELINHLRAWDGITIITARIDVVAKVENGRPVPGQTTRSIQIEKGTPYQMSAVVETGFPDPARLTEIQSLNVKIPDGGLDLPEDAALEHVIFRILGAGGTFKSGVIINPAIGIPARDAKIALLDRAKQLVANPETAEFDLEEAKALAGKCWAGVGLGDEGEITTDQFEAVMACIEPEAEAAPPVEAEDESQVEPSESAEDVPLAGEPSTPEAETPAEDAPAEVDPEPDSAPGAESSVPPDETADGPADPTVAVAPAEDEAASTTPDMVLRADAMEILTTIARSITSTPLAAETLVGNVWIEAGHGVAPEITSDDLEALVEAISAVADEAPESGTPVDGATEPSGSAEVAQEPPAEPDPEPAPEPAKPVAKKAGKAAPAAPPTQEALIP